MVLNKNATLLNGQDSSLKYLALAYYEGTRKLKVWQTMLLEKLHLSIASSKDNLNL